MAKGDRLKFRILNYKKYRPYKRKNGIAGTSGMDIHSEAVSPTPIPTKIFRNKIIKKNHNKLTMPITG
ncbi:MAG: hypothetical protein COB78_01240 [Hyphomicrobiales bacterium]|nr:MAG: hypothetical protein COB78_01240 [Hyphomicrobiales bacterium]